MSRSDISCHPSVALDVEFEIWDVKPSRNILLRVSYLCSIAPQYRYFKNIIAPQYRYFKNMEKAKFQYGIAVFGLQ